ncbi:fatty acyl-CoA reductase 1-like [Nylanderia fulva]|uniref:fatty acyl-CoA reductase 1-like n=1 Tax=Nylanderia fulva TaxID=613905 RepID=UPI0010FB5F72|nr:fatty acyl-CoA reductase 1-like [Nylanderia fulva]
MTDQAKETADDPIELIQNDPIELQNDPIKLQNDSTKSIAEVFSDCTVLVTGGLGLLGTLLIEKLLRFCPKVKTLYVLVRKKDGKSLDERVKQLAEMPLYKKLNKEQPNFLKKLTLIEGNLDTENLGLSPEDRDKLLDTEVIFHGTVIIRSNLCTMANIHVKSTEQILLLAKNMSNLKAFVHLSTVFAHWKHKSIKEKHYTPPRGYNIVSELNGSWLNTFAYTKAIAEETVLRYCDKIPACIVRPSVVTSTWKEPIMGWVDSVYGPVGLLVGSDLGLLRTIDCDTNKKLDLVPADYVTSCLIAAAWCTMKNAEELKKKDSKPDIEKVPVYNFVSSCQEPITWRKFQEYVRAHRSTKLLSMFWNNTLWMQHKILGYLSYLLPAVVANRAVVLAGQNASRCMTYNLMNSYLESMHHFMTQQLNIENKATVKLWEQMSAEDRKIFEFDMRNFDWNEYVKQMIKGIHEIANETSNDVV